MNIYSVYNNLEYSSSFSNRDNLSFKFANGGEEELNLVIDLYGQDILRYCHNILCDYYDAEDATLRKRYERAKKKLAEALKENNFKY